MRCLDKNIVVFVQGIALKRGDKASEALDLLLKKSSDVKTRMEGVNARKFLQSFNVEVFLAMLMHG